MLNRLSGQYRIRILAIVTMAATGLFCPYSEAMAADAVQARKDIRAMGLEFTGSAFATVAGNDDLTAVQLFLDAGMDVNAGVTGGGGDLSERSCRTSRGGILRRHHAVVAGGRCCSAGGAAGYSPLDNPRSGGRNIRFSWLGV